MQELRSGRNRMKKQHCVEGVPLSILDFFSGEGETGRSRSILTVNQCETQMKKAEPEAAKPTSKSLRQQLELLPLFI